LSLLFANTPRHRRAAHVALNFSRCRCTWWQRWQSLTPGALGGMRRGPTCS